MSEPAPEARADAELVRRGLVRSRALAVHAIREGRVSLDGRVLRKPSERVGPAAALVVVGESRHVARSAGKLEAALDAFRIDPSGRLALDVGASTGGFTQVLLERGAREVIALDVGHDQLVPELRRDPRVRVVEGVNARELDPPLLATVAGTSERPGVVVADLSFISLRTVLPAIRSVAAESADLVLLVKPQFEVGRQAITQGIATARADRHAAVEAVIAAAEEVGLRAGGVIASPILGSSGNQEYLIALGPASTGSPWREALADLP